MNHTHTRGKSKETCLQICSLAAHSSSYFLITSLIRIKHRKLFFFSREEKARGNKIIERNIVKVRQAEVCLSIVFTPVAKVILKSGKKIVTRRSFNSNLKYFVLIRPSLKNERNCCIIFVTEGIDNVFTNYMSSFLAMAMINAVFFCGIPSPYLTLRAGVITGFSRGR